MRISSESETRFLEGVPDVDGDAARVGADLGKGLLDFSFGKRVGLPLVVVALPLHHFIHRHEQRPHDSSFLDLHLAEGHELTARYCFLTETRERGTAVEVGNVARGNGTVPQLIERGGILDIHVEFHPSDHLGRAPNELDFADRADLAPTQAKGHERKWDADGVC